MTRITVKFTARELELLSSLASDQLFRIEFIDSRLPGFKSNVGELSLGKQLVTRLRSMADRASRTPQAKNVVAALKRSGASVTRANHDDL